MSVFNFFGQIVIFDRTIDERFGIFLRLLEILVMICISAEAIHVVFQQSLKEDGVDRKHDEHGEGESEEVDPRHAVVPHEHAREDRDHSAEPTHNERAQVHPGVHSVQQRVEINLETKLTKIKTFL